MLPSAPIWLIVIAFLGMLGPVVFFHELGHYSVARLFGIPAESFSIGFGRELVGWTDRRGTRWKIGWLPLGGYVKFVGDMSPASEPGDLEHVPEELRHRVFQVKPVWQRFLVVLAGPAANFVLAILIFTAFFSLVGTPQTNVIGDVVARSSAANAGIRPGDRIVSIAHRDTPTFDAIANVVLIRPDQTVPVEIERKGHAETINVKLGSQVVSDGPGRTFKAGVLGIRSTTAIGQPVSLLRAVPLACERTAGIVRTLIDGLGQLITGHVSPKQLGGPITIARVAGSGAELGLLPFIGLLAFISINLGFINLLPVPMLDGGHLFFYVIEAVRRRPLSAEALEFAFRGGLALVFALMLFLTINDLGRVGLWDGLQRLIG